MVRKRYVYDGAVVDAPAFVRALRTTLKLSQMKFATICGVQLNTVYRWEVGASDPSPKSWKCLCELWDTTRGVS